MQAKRWVIKQLQWWLSASVMALLGVCTVQASEPVAAEPDNNLRFAQVRAQPAAYQGLQVRWSGTVAAVENRGEKETVLLIGDQALDDSGQAQADISSQGLFMAKINRFLNPTVYAGQFVTVAGTLVGSESREIYDDSDSYPFVVVHDYHLSPGSRQTTTRYHFHSCRDSSSPYPWSQFGYGHLFKQCSP